jgi:hypothetical protein
MLGPPPPFPVGGGGPWIGMGNQNQSEVAVLLQPRLDDDAPSPLLRFCFWWVQLRAETHVLLLKLKKRGRVFISQELWRALHATAR